MINQLNPLIWMVFGLLGASLTLGMVAWRSDQGRSDLLTLFCFVTAYCLGLVEGVVTAVSIVPILFMVFCAWLYGQPGQLRWLGLSGIVINAILVFTHKYPGFHNPIAIGGLLVSADAIPYNLYLNFDKAALAWSLLQFGGINKPAIPQLIRGLRHLLPVLMLAPVILLFFAYAFGYAHWDPKFGAYLWIWLPTNLLFTCIAEELIFRELFLGRLHGIRAILPMAVVCSLLFGVAHFAGGWKYVLLASIAGGIYSWAYIKTGKYSLFSVLAHLWVNLVHTLLFTYPALA